MDENKKLNLTSKLKLRIDIPKLSKPFFNRITTFPNAIKKIDEASKKINNKENLIININDTKFELPKKEIKIDKLETIIPEKYESAHKSILENEAGKSNVLTLESVNITSEQIKSMSDYEQFGTGSIEMLDQSELSKIPDIIDGHILQDYHKMELIAGGLDLSEYGTNYSLQENKIVRTQLNEELIPEKSEVLTSDVVFDATELREEKYSKENPIELPTITQAESLPEGWKWEDWKDGSGALLSPENNSYYRYDLQSKEFISPINNTYQKVNGEFDLSIFKELSEANIVVISQNNSLKKSLTESEINSLSKFENYSGKIKDIAANVINDPSRFNKLDINHQNIIIAYYKSSGQEKLFEMNYNKFMADTWAKEISSKTDLSSGMTNTQIDEKQANYYRKYEIAAKTLNIPISPINQFVESKKANENLSKNLDILLRNIGGIGFTTDENLKNELKSKVAGTESDFTITQSSEKNFFKSNEINFELNFHRSKETGTVFFNSYNVNLKNENRNVNISQNINLKQIPFTAKEAINLIEGRSVRTEINLKGGKKEDVFVKLDFNEKQANGNFQMRKFFPQYGVNTNDILKNAKVFIAPNREDIKDKIVKSLEKGNVVPLLVDNGSGEKIKLNAILNPHYKTLNLYNSKMERVNEKQSLDAGAKQQITNTETTSQQHNHTRKQ